MTQKTIDFIKSSWLMWALWAIWWLTHYLYKVAKWKKFVMSLFIINIIVASIVAIWIWNLLEPLDYSNNIKYTVIMLAWYFCYPLLDILEEHGPKVINLLLKKK